METKSNKKEFNREVAFSRTIGFITHDELKTLKDKTVAIAGLGGVGGSHFLTLIRLGVGGFHIAEMDTFGIENFNRQTGANMNTIDRPKIEVMEEMGRAINPDIRITKFPAGINADNIDLFLDGVDAYVDSLDFFAFKARQLVFEKCEQKKIPATTVGPIGMGAALVNFIPGKMSFMDYFQWKKTDSDVALGVKFLVGVTPAMPHRTYNVDLTASNFKEKRGPSTPMGIELCAGVMGSEMLKILLNRGPVRSAPHAILYDAYHNKLFHKYVLFGNKNPIQRLKIFLATRMLNGSLSKSN